LFRQDPRAGYQIAGLSPKGDKLIVYQFKDGRTTALSADLNTGASKALVDEPFCCTFWSRGQGLTWLSDDEVLLITNAPYMSDIVGHTRELASKVERQWNLSFAQKEPSTTVLSSTALGSTQVDGGRTARLSLVNVTTGSVRVLAHGMFTSLFLSPNKGLLAAIKMGGRIQRPAFPKLSALQPSNDNELILFDLRRGQSQRLTCSICNVIDEQVAWSPDSSRVAFEIVDFGTRSSPQTVVYDAKAHRGATVYNADFSYACNPQPRPEIALTSDPHAVLKFGHTSSVDEFGSEAQEECGSAARNDWYVIKLGEKPKKLSSDGTHLERYPLNTGNRGEVIGVSGNRLVALHESGSPGVLATFSPAGEFWQGQTPLADTGSAIHFQTGSVIRTVALPAGRERDITSPSPAATLTAINLDGTKAVFREVTSSHSRLLYVNSEGKTRLIDETNEYLSSIAWPRHVALAAREAAQGSARACLLMPADWTPGTRYPIVVSPYPVPERAECLDSYNDAIEEVPTNSLAILAGAGYGVLYIGTGPYGKERISTITPRVTQAVDDAIADGFADPKRLFLYGFSQGMYDVLRVITESNRFRAAFVGFGISSPASAYGQMSLRSRFEARIQLNDQGRFDSDSAKSANGLGGPPWADPESYVDASLPFHANAISTPLLIANGDFDIFPVAQSEEIFSALYAQRKEAEFVTYWGEEHGPHSPANVRDYWTRIMRWFGEHGGIPVH
jgi:dienelactone hydrolase